jgi:hypothetical protein
MSGIELWARAGGQQTPLLVYILIFNRSDRSVFLLIFRCALAISFLIFSLRVSSAFTTAAPRAAAPRAAAPQGVFFC